MKILVINAGSSSLKYQLVDMRDETVLCKGLAERIGIEGSRLTHEANGGEWVVNEALPTHVEAFSKMLEMMTQGEGAVVKTVQEIDAVGHRVAHGGEKFTGSVAVSEEMIAVMDEMSVLAPLHNPPQVAAIRSAQKVFPAGTPMVGVFDTAFHQTMPPEAYLYGVPYEYYEKYAIRRYGFHGTSHWYVSLRAAEYLGKQPQELNLITCHLGSGSSVAAIKKGKSIDTSMGFSPLCGTIMGTRPGDLDPGILTYIEEKEGKSFAELNNMMYKESGLLGLSGVSSDKRDIEAAAAKGNKRAQLTLDVLDYQVKKYIGAYAAALGGVDAVVFTGGIGENSTLLRGNVCAGLGFMGIAVDQEKNKQRGGDVMDISAEGATVRTLVIKTDEELMIARETLKVVRGG